jgi:hypothetical protein
MRSDRFFHVLTVLSVCVWTAGSAASSAWADTVHFKNGEQLKGLVVEEHEDRVVLSTADGEMPVLRKVIDKIDFDDPAYTLLSMGRQLERSKKYGEALSYYEKAHQLNPSLEEARTASIGVRSKMWAGFTEGPTSEILKQQEIQDAWREDTSLEDQARRGEEQDESLLWKRMGLRVEQEGDFVKAAEVRVGGYAHQAGVRLNDAVHAIDGRSMRYIQKRAVQLDLLNPRYASMTVEVRRKIHFPAKVGRTDLKSIGMDLRQEYNGVVIWRVKRGSPAEKYGIKAGDRLVLVGDENTRYMPLPKIGQAFKTKQGKAFTVETGRTLQMARP